MAEKIQLTMLGTGSAVPTVRRNHPAMLLQYKSENILIDCGEGTQRQFRKAKLNPCKLTKILITHWHGDHILGIPGLLQTLMLNGYNKTLEIYGPRGTKQKMEKLLDLFMKWYLDISKKQNKKFNVKVKEIIEDGKIIDEKEFFIEAKEMQHDMPCIAYSFVLKQKQRLDKKKLEKLNIQSGPLIKELLNGKKVKIDNKTIDGKKIIFTEPQKKITFIMDTRQNAHAIQISKEADILICEATYGLGEEELAKQHAHLTSTQSAEIAKQSKSKRLILTHLSQRYETKNQQEEILHQAKKIFKKTEIAQDLDKIEL